jgi:hypothetical protein
MKHAERQKVGDGHDSSKRDHFVLSEQTMHMTEYFTRTFACLSDLYSNSQSLLRFNYVQIAGGNVQC